MQITDIYFSSLNLRNYVISDSTFAGAGEYGYHIVTGATSTF